MTDYPRFQMPREEPDICHRHHFGAALVEWVFRAADWWLLHRDAVTGFGVVVHRSQSKDTPGYTATSKAGLDVC